MGNNLELVLSQNNSYDDVPYESVAIQNTNPYFLGALGTLFGMQPCSMKNCRVLEIGCADGSNIIPHALAHPDSIFVGIDLSKVHIEQANFCKTSLKLKNIEFHNISITDFNENFGKFDYIICHGVFSWVPKAIRAKILSVCNKNLNDNGIAYISYNVLPGWNMLKTLRELMLYHVSNFSSHANKISQSTVLLNFIKDYVSTSNPYIDFLKKEATALITNHKANYWFHEHLEQHNKAFYFYEFINKAKKYNLQYLSDCFLPSMDLNKQSDNIKTVLQWANDIIKTEQYYDFFNNRRFRATLLCRDAINLSRKINYEDIVKFNIICSLTAAIPLSQININDSSQEIRFFLGEDQDVFLAATLPIEKAIYYSLAETSYPLNVDEIVNLANKKLGGGVDLIAIKNILLHKAMDLVFDGYIYITLQANNSKNINKSQPKISKHNLFIANHTAKMTLTNVVHKNIAINFLEKNIIKYMDGSNSQAQICNLVEQDFKNDKIVWLQEYTKEESKLKIKENVEQTIEMAYRNGLLI